MKLKLDIDPDIVAMMAAEVAAGERAVTAAMREVGTGLKSAWRLQITGAGFGSRLARTIRSEQFPKATPILNAAAVVWFNAPVIVGAHRPGRAQRRPSRGGRSFSPGELLAWPGSDGRSWLAGPNAWPVSALGIDRTTDSPAQTKSHSSASADPQCWPPSQDGGSSAEACISFPAWTA
jgi:hypothetical protein